MTPNREVQEFVKAHQGPDWSITSILAYRFKDTGDWCWIIHLRRKNWMRSPGEREATLLVTQVQGKFSARPVDAHRLYRIHLDK
jgi:hypothetical protein